MFREKNEYRISGAYGFGDESDCIEIQSAYSLSDNIGIQANLMHAWGGDVSERDFGRGTCFDGGLGYYKPVSASGVMEIYGGFGGCIQNHEYSGLNYNSVTGSIFREYDGSSHLTFFKLFLQPSFGLTYNLVDFILSARLSGISFMSIENNIFGDTYNYDKLNSISDHGQLFIEPAVTIRGGWQKVKIQAQALYCWHANMGDTSIGEEFHFSAGLIFTMSGKAK